MAQIAEESISIYTASARARAARSLNANPFRRRRDRSCSAWICFRGTALPVVIRRRVLATRVDAGGARIRVKTANRPDGTTTAKADMDDIAAAAGDRAAREALRRRIEDTHGTEDGR